MIDGIINATSIEKNRLKFTVASNPEFLAEGTAVNDLMKPDRVVLGHQKDRSIESLSRLYDYAGKDRVIFTNNASA
jgi:UDPglucose 6-dehydrogenase